MALKTLTNITEAQLRAHGVSALATRPNAPSTYGEGGLSAEELKARFDSLGKMLAQAINAINTALSTEGASYIGVAGLGTIASLADLTAAYLDGTFSNVLKAYEKAADIGDTGKLKTLQTILSGFSQRLAEVESVGDATTLEQAKAYTDTQDTAKLAEAKSYADTKDTANLTAAKSYVDTKVAALINSAPAAYDTLKEIADWIASDISGTAALIARVAALEDDFSGSGSQATVSFTQAGTRANIASGETLAVLMGKIKKYFADLGSLAFASSISYNSLTDKPTLGTAAARNTGTASGNVPVINSSGKIERDILPNADDAGYLGVVAGQSFANRYKAGATYHEVLIDSAGMAYAFYPIIDTAMSDTSVNLVQNKIIKAYIDGIVGDIETLLAEV
jgi:hypothetical protein